MKQLAAGVWNSNTSLVIQGGQVMRFEVKNVNLLGTTITISEQGGQSKSSIILPQTTWAAEFSAFGNEPMGWSFDISTESDAFIVAWTLYSTWVPGDPPNPPQLNNGFREHLRTLIRTKAYKQLQATLLGIAGHTPTQGANKPSTYVPTGPAQTMEPGQHVVPDRETTRAVIEEALSPEWAKRLIDASEDNPIGDTVSRVVHDFIAGCRDGSRVVR